MVGSKYKQANDLKIVQNRDTSDLVLSNFVCPLRHLVAVQLANMGIHVSRQTRLGVVIGISTTFFLIEISGRRHDAEGDRRYLLILCL
jgi:hypothetical protein